ncbi:ABC transporter permease subunit [Candidatus Poribacteria bacterium]|nr:ABC transporter permease subunit [Candidatus Poribacteria bacterium]
MWHIAKRELYDNLNSLRFALTTVLLLGLMLTNAVVHLREQPARGQKYLASVTNARNALEARADSLYELAQKGPGKLYKKTSVLHFCAEGGDPFLSSAVEAHHYFWENGDLKSFWQMRYPTATSNLTNIRPDVTKIDWAFVIGYVLSLIALLFTFDSVAGERESGTLRLMLANSVPRHTVLIGKFLGALMSISIPFALAVLVNLLVFSMSSAIHLSADAWGRLGIICFVALLYTCLFLTLGLLVSARVQRSAVSLVMLLLTWVTLVVFMPSVLALIASGFSAPMSNDELRVLQKQINDKHLEEYRSVLGRSRSEALHAGSKYVTHEAAEQERLIEKRLNEQVAQVQHARSITRVSPTAILQHLLESFAGTGFERHLQFLENAQRYASEYRKFIVDTDRGDPESLHLIGIRKAMSQKPVRPESIPIFEDTISLSRDFNTAAMDLLLLMLFFIVLLSGAYLAFVRVEV